MFDTRVDVLIVGAGLAGASTAHHLARNSDLRIGLLEKEAVAGEHSSGRNASFIREHMEEAALQPLASEGAAFLRRGTVAEYVRCGAMLMGLGDDDAREHCSVARGKGRWCPEDGVVDVAALLQWYLAGQRVRYNTEVLAYERQGNEVVVRTNCGETRCGLLVNATGPWAGRFGRLPLTPMKRHVYVTPPMDWVDPMWPFIWDLPKGLYFRPESGGLLLSACDETASEPGDYSEDPAVLESLAEKVARFQPDLGELSILRSWTGHRVFTADHRFVIGFDPRDEKLFHVAALGGHGVTTSYAVGLVAARRILGEKTEYDSLFDPARIL